MAKAKFQANQRGFASIVIALVLILVLALITIGFAQMARREQQAALDKQLSTQAYYAAETAINDAIKCLKTTGCSLANSPNTCTTIPGYSQNVNTSTGTSYSCLLIEKEPKSLVYTNVPVGGARNVAFNSAVGLNTMTISWGSNTRNTYRPTVSGFPAVTAWTAPAAIQFSLTPLTAMDRSSLFNSTFTTYLYPAVAGSSSVPFSDPSVPIVSGACSGTGTHPCKATITGLGGRTDFLIHMLNYYDISNIAITATDTAGNPVSFRNAQYQVDATGKSRDVLKRLQVRIPAVDRVDLANFAVQARDLCKRLQTEPSTTTFIQLSGSTASPGQACYLSD